MVQFTTNAVPSSPSLLILQSPQSSHNHHHHYCHVTITTFRQFWTRLHDFGSNYNMFSPSQEEQVKSHSGRFHRSYPNFKPSNPKSQLAWFVGNSLVSTSLPPFRPNQQKNPLKNRRKNSFFFRKFSWGAFTSGDSPSLRRRLLNSVNRTAPGEFGGSAMMDWVAGQWWRGGRIFSREKKVEFGEKSWGMMMEFSEWIRQGYLVAASNEFHTTFDFFWWGINTYSPFLFILRKRDAQRNKQSFRVIILS